MRKLLAVSVGAVIAGAFAVVACVADSPAYTPPTNGTSSGGTSSSSSGGTSSGGTSSGDVASVDASSGGTPDSAPAPCKFQTTPFPCGDSNPPTACYGATQSCSLTGCSTASDLRWECNSPNQCSTLPCCVPAETATVNAGQNCAEGALLITTGATTGARCATATTCSAGETRLCQASSHCAPGERCTPLKFANAGAALNGNIIGACVK